MRGQRRYRRTALLGLALVGLAGCADLDRPGQFVPLTAIEPGAGPVTDETALALASSVVLGDLLVGGRTSEQLARVQAGIGAVEPAAGDADESVPIVLTDPDSPDRQARRLAAFNRLAEAERRQRRLDADKAMLFEQWMRARVEPPPMERTDVRRAQQLLAVLGYLDGPVDGLYGPLTRGAIERFEAGAGLPVSGTVTPALVERLALEL